MMVEDDGELHTINLFKDRYNLRQDERKGQAMSNKQWKLPVAEKRSRGKSTGLGARVFEQKIMEICAAKNIYAKNLLKEAEEATGLVKSGHMRDM